MKSIKGATTDDWNIDPEETFLEYRIRGKFLQPKIPIDEDQQSLSEKLDMSFNSPSHAAQSIAGIDSVYDEEQQADVSALQ